MIIRAKNARIPAHIVCTEKKSFRLKKLFLGISPIVYAHGVRDQTVKGNGGFPKKRPPRTHPPPPHRRSPYSAFEQRDWSGDGPPVRPPPPFYRMVHHSSAQPPPPTDLAKAAARSLVLLVRTKQQPFENHPRPPPLPLTPRSIPQLSWLPKGRVILLPPPPPTRTQKRDALTPSQKR